MRQYSYSQVHNVVLLCLMHWAMALKWRSFFCVVESSFSPGGGWNLNLWLHLKRSAFFPVFLHWCDWDSYYFPKTYGHCHPASPTVGKSDLSCRKTTRLMSCQCFHIQLTCELGGEPVYCQKTIPTLTRMHSQSNHRPALLYFPTLTTTQTFRSPMNTYHSFIQITSKEYVR